MAISIRGTFVRPTTDTVWSMYVFFGGLTYNIDTLDSTGKVTTYMKGNPATDLTLIVDHYVSDDAWFVANKDMMMNHLPLWVTPDNTADVDAYHAANGITITLEEIFNPDLTGYTPIREVPRPDLSLYE